MAASLPSHVRRSLSLVLNYQAPIGAPRSRFSGQPLASVPKPSRQVRVRVLPAQTRIPVIGRQRSTNSSMIIIP